MGVSIGDVFPRFLFENFVCDESNINAFSTAKLITMGQVFRVPIYIHSKAGLGKTHLLHAIANEALRRAPTLKVALISAEWFVTELISAMRTDAGQNFMDKIRERHNIFMVDELSFINKKPLIQKELLKILKEQSDNGCRVVMASSLPLTALTKTDNEFKDWLQSGMDIKITTPSIKSRRHIIKKYLAEHEMPPNDELIDCIRLAAGSSFRELEGAVIRIQAGASLFNKKPTADFARKVLKNRSLKENTKNHRRKKTEKK